MESPERVRRVMPPSTTSAHTHAAHPISHPPTALSAAAPPATSACSPASAAADVAVADVAEGDEVGVVDAAAGVGAGLAAGDVAGDVAEGADVAEEVWSVRITLAEYEREGEADDWSAAEIVEDILGGMLLIARMCGLLMLSICCTA
ncbi:unnamed protein product [Closterium sp. NIES-54]